MLAQTFELTQSFRDMTGRPSLTYQSLRLRNSRRVDLYRFLHGRSLRDLEILATLENAFGHFCFELR